jgi:hypothetical protein
MNINLEITSFTLIKKFQQKRSRRKMWSCILQGASLKKERPMQVSHQPHEVIQQADKELWAAEDVKLLHENTPAHLPILVQHECTKHNNAVLPNPPYPCDISLHNSLLSEKNET